MTEERNGYTRHIYSTIGKFKCLVDNPCESCRWFQQYKPSEERFVPIGWCSQFEPDPDSGYVLPGENPPCLTWQWEKREERGEYDGNCDENCNEV